LVTGLIEDAHDIVVASLPRRAREALGE